MELTILKTVLDSLYGFDIMTKTRRRKYAYARKVLFKLSRELGYGPLKIGEAFDVGHDLVIHHNKTFSDVTSLDLIKHNAAIDQLSLPVDKIQSRTQLVYGSYISDMVEQLSALSVKELRRFNDKKLKPFLQELKSEREIREMGYESKSNR